MDSLPLQGSTLVLVLCNLFTNSGKVAFCYKIRLLQVIKGKVVLQNNISNAYMRDGISQVWFVLSHCWAKTLHDCTVESCHPIAVITDAIKCTESVMLNE